MGRKTPCPFCHKWMLTRDEFRENVIEFPVNKREYRISSKIIDFGGRKAHVHYILDVTSLIDREKELRTLTDHIPTGIGIYYYYPDGRLEAGYINDGYYKMMDTTREERMEYSGFAVYNAIHPKDLGGLKKATCDAVRDNRQIYYEMRVQKNDGSYKWVSIRANIFEKTDEKATLYCAYSDIDKLKKSQEEQLDREHRYEEEIRLKTKVSSDVKILAIVDLTRDSITELDAMNSQLSEYFNLNSIDEVINAVCQDFVHPFDREEYLTNFSRERMLGAYAKGIMRENFRHRINSTNDWYESAFDLVLNPYNCDIEAIASIRNVTEIVRSEQVIDTLMKIDYESILTIDAMTGEPSVFEESGQIKGVIDEQRKAKNNVEGVEIYLRKHCTDSDIDRVIKETSLPYVVETLNKVPVHTTTYTLNIDGKRSRKRVVYAYLDQTKSLILCARQDVTAAYEQEMKKNEKLEKALYEAKEANQSKSEFFAHMSHDMRTPLNGILGSVNLAIDEEKHSPQMEEYLHDIQFSGDFLLNLINDILEISKIENGAMELFPEEYTYFE